MHQVTSRRENSKTPTLELSTVSGWWAGSSSCCQGFGRSVWARRRGGGLAGVMPFGQHFVCFSRREEASEVSTPSLLGILSTASEEKGENPLAWRMALEAAARALTSMWQSTEGRQQQAEALSCDGSAGKCALVGSRWHLHVFSHWWHVALPGTRHRGETERPTSMPRRRRQPYKCGPSLTPTPPVPVPSWSHRWFGQLFHLETSGWLDRNARRRESLGGFLELYPCKTARKRR